MSEPPDGARGLRAIFSTGALQVVALLIMVARSKAFALLLGPVGVGILSTLDQLVQFIVQASSFGLTLAPTRVVSQAVRHGPEAVARAYRALLLALAALVGFATAIALTVASVRADLLVADATVPTSAVVLAIAGTPCAALILFLTGMFAVTNGHRTSMTFGLCAAAGSLLLSYAGALAGGIVGLYAGSLLAALGTVAAGIALLAPIWRAAPSVRSVATVRSELTRHDRLAAFLGSLYVLSFSQPLAFLIVRYVLVATHGAEEAGEFQAVYAISGVVSMLLMQSVRVWFEPQANLISDPRERARLSHRFAGLLAGLMVAGAVPVALLPDLAIRLLFSAAFLEAAPTLYLFLLSECVFVASSVYSATLRAQNDIRWDFIANVSGQCVLAATAWLLIPTWGITGAGIACVVGRLSTATIALARMTVLTGVVPQGVVPQGLIAIGASLGACGLLLHVGLQPDLDSLAARGGIAVAFVIGIVTLLLGRPEYHEIRAAAGRALGRAGGR